MSYILDPLSAVEIQLVVSLVKSASYLKIDGKDVIFAEISLIEPDKYNVINSIKQDRLANCLIYRNLGNKTYQYKINLTRSKIVIKNLLVEGIIPAMDYSNGVAFWPWMAWEQAGYTDMFSIYIQNMINEPNNVSALKYRQALSKRGITPDQIGDYSCRYTPIWNFEMSRLVVPSYCKCDKCGKNKKSIKNNGCFCNCTNFEDCNCVCPEKINKTLVDGRYFLPFLLDNTSDGLAGNLDGFFFIFDSSKLNSFGTPGVIVLTSDEYIADPLPKADYAPTPKLFKHPAPNVLPVQPLTTITSKTPSFQLTGSKLLFDNWSMRLSVDPRVGLQFYQIEYYDSTLDTPKYRPILYKASIADAMVFYNSPKPIWARNYTSSDSYSYPMAFRLVSLTLGQDVPSTATLIDISLFNNDGSQRTIKGGIAIYEEDSDLAWRATNGGTGWFPGVQSSPTSNPPEPGTGQGARGRALVFRTVFTGFFYCWIYTWRFFQDGSMDFNVRLGGFTTTQLLPYETSEEAHKKGYYGEFIAPHIFAMLHTHMHCARLDFQIDGVENSVEEENFVKIENVITSEFPYGTNPSGFALNLVETTLKTELEAVRDVNPGLNRSWSVVNPNVLTPGMSKGDYHPGYGIDSAGTGTVTQTLPCSTVNTNLEFIQHNLHVTKYNPNEMYGSGNYPIQQDKDVGLGQYIKNNDNIENTDVVVWYTMSIQHPPKTEDFPYIQVHEQGFKLVPHNFFNCNPSIGGDSAGVGVRNFNNTFFV